jgi:glutamine cyclotransferase
MTQPDQTSTYAEPRPRSLLGLAPALCLALVSATCTPRAETGGPTPAPVAPGTTAAQAPAAPAPPVARYRLRILRSYPHDPRAFTQGLLFRDGQLFESTGQRGDSSLRRVDLESGTVLQSVDFASSPALGPDGSRLFAEGLECLGDVLYQLTWQEQTCLVWDRHSFELLGRFSYAGEGWGLCSDGERLILSDGLPTGLRFFERSGPGPLDFREQPKRLEVTFQGRLVDRINELEWIDGQIWANRWQSNEIVRIDPVNGRVVGLIDCGILERQVALEPDIPVAGFGPQNVLNGIAWDPIGKRLFLTGKHWPKLFEVELEPR